MKSLGDGILRRLGIDPDRFRLLTDLFGQLSERRELLTQLGRESMTLGVLSWIYLAMMALFSVVYVTMGTPLVTYSVTMLLMTTAILATVLFSETGNSLVNPADGLVLAHQPINGATYTAAKLSHLVRILLMLVPALNGPPALAGLMLEGAFWYYPILHLGLAFGLGLAVASLSCAVFGWLLRFVPPSRMKSAGQIAELMAWLSFVAFPHVERLSQGIPIEKWLPARSDHRAALAIAGAAIIAVLVVLGIRALSGDYLVRVSSILHGGSAAKVRETRSRLGEWVGRWFGGPPARAGFEYVWRMMLRDWNFRRAVAPPLIALILPVLVTVRGIPPPPFAGGFSAAHLAPHAFGTGLFLLATLLVYGDHHKGAWIFLLAPSRAFRPFTHGVFALLWLRFVVIPHAILLLPLAWAWGVMQAALFVAYSLSVASVYLGLELRLIGGMPFTKQPDASQRAMMLPLMIAGGIVIAIAVALQYLVVFRSLAAVALATLVSAAGAWFATRSSLEAFEGTIRFHLGLLSAETGMLYKEVD